MYFNHIPIEEIKRPFIEKIENEKGHFYKTNSGEIYPSITTVLRTLTNPGIQKWREYVGDAEANRISKESVDVGTALHSLIEHTLNNENLDDYSLEFSEYAISPQLLLDAIKPELSAIDNVRALETKLYSKEMKIAGTVDCIAEYDGVLSIIDFKNSRKPKTKSRVKNYFLQETAYAQMWWECIDEHIDQGVTIIANWDGTSTVFKTNLVDHMNELWDVLLQYEKTV